MNKSILKSLNREIENKIPFDSLSSNNKKIIIADLEKYYKNKNMIINNANHILYTILCRDYIINNKNKCLKINNENNIIIGNNIKIDSIIKDNTESGLVCTASFININSKLSAINKFYIKIIKNNVEDTELKVLEFIRRIFINSCPHFPLLYGYLKCNDIYTSYDNYPKFIKKNPENIILLIEAAKGTYDDFYKIHYNNNNLILNTLIQIYLSLMFFYKYIQSFHVDCHSGNYLYYKVDDNYGYYHYIINGIDYYLKNSGYIFVIWDFDMILPFDNSNSFLTTKKLKRMDITRDFYEILDFFINNNEDEDSSKRNGEIHSQYKFNDEINRITDNLNHLLIDYKNENKHNDINNLRELENLLLNSLSINTEIFTTINPGNIINNTPFII